MKFARIGPLGKEIPVTVKDEKFHGLRGITGDITADFLPGFDQASLETPLSDGTLSPWGAKQMRESEHPSHGPRQFTASAQLPPPA